MPFKAVPRLRGFSYTGLFRYSLTICVHERRRAFVRQEPVDLVTSQLLQSSSRNKFEVIAYCFMPDHLHLLVQGVADDSNLLEFMRVFKQTSAYHWKAAFGGQLWQRSYFEHVLRENESPLKAARYLLANPLRAGMVSRVEDYPFLGSMTMSLPDLLYSITSD